MSDMLAKKILARFQELKGLRGTWETHWQEVLDLTLPRKATVNRTRFPGDKRNLQVFDATAGQSLDLLAGMLHGLLTNTATFWFELTTGDEELDSRDDVRNWLQDTSRRMHGLLNNSNFQQAIHEVYIDLGSVGTAVLAIEEDPDRILTFNAHPIEQVFIDENNAGHVDTLYRRIKWNARQAVQEFGEQNVGEKILKLWQEGSNEQLTFIHAVMPKVAMHGIEMAIPKAMPFASIWIVEDFMQTLRMGGFKQFPFAVPRWTKATGEMYGRSPAIKALPDIKMVNEMMRTIIAGAQKTVDPPLIVPDDGFMQPIRLTPGGLNFKRAGSPDTIQPLITNARVDFGFQMLEEVQRKIRDAFFIDQMRLREADRMTATEVMQRREEGMTFLGPILGRQQNELLRPLIDRSFDVMLKRKMIKAPPEVLSGVKLDVQYRSMVARAQKAGEAQNITRAIEATAPFIQADPTIMDNYAGDNIARFIWKLFSAPQEGLNNQDQVQNIRGGRAEAAREQAEREATAQDAATAQTAAQALATVQKAQ